jgi:hypothetical protein
MVIDRAQTYMSREEKLHTSTTLVASTSTDAEIEILKAELASLKAGAVTAAGRGTGRGKQGGTQKGGGHNHATVGRGRSTETCTKCGKVGHVTSQCFQTASTIRNVIAALQHNDTNAAVPMVLVMQRLQSTDIQDYIERSYGSLLHFVQESSYTSHFQITSGYPENTRRAHEKTPPGPVRPIKKLKKPMELMNSPCIFFETFGAHDRFLTTWAATMLLCVLWANFTTAVVTRHLFLLHLSIREHASVRSTKNLG